MERYCLWQLTYGAPKGRVPLLNKCGCSWNTALYIMRKFEKAPLQLKTCLTVKTEKTNRFLYKIQFSKFEEKTENRAIF
jgi:hypothetical protein